MQTEAPKRCAPPPAELSGACPPVPAASLVQVWIAIAVRLTTGVQLQAPARAQRGRAIVSCNGLVRRPRNDRGIEARPRSHDLFERDHAILGSSPRGWQAARPASADLSGSPPENRSAGAPEPRQPAARPREPRQFGTTLACERAGRVSGNASRSPRDDLGSSRQNACGSAAETRASTETTERRRR